MAGGVIIDAGPIANQWRRSQRFSFLERRLCSHRESRLALPDSLCLTRLGIMPAAAMPAQPNVNTYASA